MKKMIATLCLLALSSCTMRTKFGPCIGVLDKEDPAIQYDLSVWNGFVGFVFAETIIVPVYVVAKDIKCPVAKGRP